MPRKQVAPRTHAFSTAQAAAADPLVAAALGLSSELYGKTHTVRRYIGLQEQAARDPWDRVVGICTFPGCASRGGHRLAFDKLLDAEVHCFLCGTNLMATTKGDSSRPLPSSEPEHDDAGHEIGWRCRNASDCAARAAAAAAGHVPPPTAGSQREHPDTAPVTRGTTEAGQERAATRAAAAPPPPPPPWHGWKRLYHPAIPPPGLADMLPGVTALLRYADFVEEHGGEV